MTPQHRPTVPDHVNGSGNPFPSIRLPWWTGDGEKALAPEAVTWRELRGDINLDLPGATAVRILDHKAKRLRILSTVEPRDGVPHYHVAVLRRMGGRLERPSDELVAFVLKHLGDVEFEEHPNPDGGPSRHFWARCEE